MHNSIETASSILTVPILPLADIFVRKFICDKSPISAVLKKFELKNDLGLLPLIPLGRKIPNIF